MVGSVAVTNRGDCCGEWVVIKIIRIYFNSLQYFFKSVKLSRLPGVNENRNISTKNN